MVDQDRLEIKKYNKRNLNMNYLKLLFAQIIGYRQYKCDESYKEN